MPATRTRRPKSTYTKPEPAPLTPEQIAAQAEIDAAWNRVDARVSEMRDAALSIAEKLYPGRVHRPALDTHFYITFGPEGERPLGFAGPGAVEMQVDIDLRGINSEALRAGTLPTKLRFQPRAYSLSGGIEEAESQGKALLEAVQAARLLSALVDRTEATEPHRHTVVAP